MITIILFYRTFNKGTLIKISFKNDLFAILVVLITMKVKFNNDFLKFLNTHSYSIYLLQRLVMLFVYRFRLFKNSAFIQLSFEFTSIFLISSLFDKYTFFVDIFLKKKLKKIPNSKYIIKSDIYVDNKNKKLLRFENEKLNLIK